MEQPKKINASIESDEEDFSRDWLKIDSSVQNDGFRTGLEASQEQSLQSGFNDGFRKAIQMALAGGRLQGSICASLICAPSQISKSISSMGFVNVESLSQVPSQGAMTSSPLQNLLSSNSDLIASIPSLLQSNLSTDLSRGPGLKPDSNSELLCGKKAPELEYLEIFPARKESLECFSGDTSHVTNEQKESQTKGQNQALSCEHVCSSRTHFWNELENFKMQAQSLGVLSSQD
uniref:Essential protein Yae1 N-terminal domain-containing protein n=1 Tax=Arion vulgaris TaxID=1028688 RepID=A0A0B6ZZ65_9EUPU